MAWSTVKEAVRSAVALALKVPDYLGGDGVTYVQRVRWEGQEDDNGWAKQGGPVVELELGRVIGHGVDERRTETITGVTPLLTYQKPHFTGTRLFSVRVRVDIDDQADTADALGWQAGLLRTRMKRDDVLAILRAANVAIIQIGETFNADSVDLDGRQLSVSLTDIRFGTTEDDFDAEDSGDWVRTAAGQGELVGDVGDTAVDTTFDTAD